MMDSKDVRKMLRERALLCRVTILDNELVDSEEASVRAVLDVAAEEIVRLRAERDALRKVDDAMVERALVAWFDEPGCPEEINSWGKVQKDSVDGGAALRVFMREALDAAMAVQP